MIEGIIKSVDGYYVTLETTLGEIMYWPKRDLPSDIQIGQSVFADLHFNLAAKEQAKDLLNSILNV